MLATALLNYGIELNLCEITTIGSGLINHTWKINFQNKNYILQRINSDVFKYPQHIDDNILLLSNYLKMYSPEYLFVSPIQSLKGDSMVFLEGFGFFRLFPFIESSITYTATENTKQSYEAAKQFGKFTRMLSGLPTNKLKIVISDFHNLSLRYAQFMEAIKKGNKERSIIAKEMISYLLAQKQILEDYEGLIHQNIFTKRVTHYDTKISNVLFNENDEGICVIDLDTIMPGYFISDVGDMIRTYVCPVTEEEKDTSKILIREAHFEAIVNGYLSEMRDELNDREIKYFVYAGKFMIYMQAIRFLTDYLNNDIYYGAKYETHNLVRANNQMELLKALIEKEILLNNIVINTLENNPRIGSAISY
ncbi:phosphotransferase enzyme family protein [Arachidicoccus soli]|uniref:Aminoglycoside phosphotransferase family protein n=1 Tax=Arachidicoccus soli TaxID=2341117 RepID=A0A386HNJ3_9BACT|nr:aminoglycoside phosphotransferase family protein [Arachidicoccus soli]AYD47323.1 aminoglycoside phosphotransferase family protein [Arachidicoccus soli]